MAADLIAKDAFKQLFAKGNGEVIGQHPKGGDLGIEGANALVEGEGADRSGLDLRNVDRFWIGKLGSF